MSLDALKEIKKIEINENTVNLLDKGFEYANMIFPISEEDQRNYLGLNVAALNQLVTGQQILDFQSSTRLKVKGHDEDGNTVYHEFVDCGDVIMFFLAGMAFVNGTLQSGWYLKDLVDQASTEDDLNNIIDNRT